MPKYAILPKYVSVNIEYNEEKNIHKYLDMYGKDILRALTAGDTTVEEGLDVMREWYRDSPINIWLIRHPEIKRGEF